MELFVVRHSQVKTFSLNSCQTLGRSSFFFGTKKGERGEKVRERDERRAWKRPIFKEMCVHSQLLLLDKTD